MIAYLRGRIIYRDIEKSSIILETNGVGYEIYVPVFSGAAGEPVSGEPASFFVYTYVREDRITLYGFYTSLQREIFSLLLDVNDIGPKLAVTVLSSIDAGNFLNILTTQDISALCAIKGIGRAKAERIIMELKNKVLKKASLSAGINAADLYCENTDSASPDGINSGARIHEPDSGVRNGEKPEHKKAGGAASGADSGGVSAPKQPADIIIETARALEVLGYSRTDSFGLASRVFGVLKAGGNAPDGTEDLTKECLKHIYSQKNL